MAARKRRPSALVLTFRDRVPGGRVGQALFWARAARRRAWPRLPARRRAGLPEARQAHGRPQEAAMRSVAPGQAAVFTSMMITRSGAAMRAAISSASSSS